MAILDYADDIHRDTHVCGTNVYAGNGQGCGTVWYSNVPQARRIIKALGKAPHGRDSGLCVNCKCHFRYQSKEWKKATDYACKEWKAHVAQCSQD